jgi:hypothetical protein
MSETYAERIFISKTRTAAVVEPLEIERPHPVLWVEDLQLWDEPKFLLKLWVVTEGEFHCFLPTGCYMFTLQNICDIQCFRLVSIMYLGMCIETGFRYLTSCETLCTVERITKKTTMSILQNYFQMQQQFMDDGGPILYCHQLVLSSEYNITRMVIRCVPESFRALVML